MHPVDAYFMPHLDELPVPRQDARNSQGEHDGGQDGEVGEGVHGAIIPRGPRRVYAAISAIPITHSPTPSHWAADTRCRPMAPASTTVTAGAIDETNAAKSSRVR